MLKLIAAVIANNHVLEYLKVGVMRLPFFVARISTGAAKGEEKYRKLTVFRKYLLSVSKIYKVEIPISFKA